MGLTGLDREACGAGRLTTRGAVGGVVIFGLFKAGGVPKDPVEAIGP
jgi:hypothetical protein